MNTSTLTAGIFHPNIWKIWKQQLLQLFYKNTRLSYDFGRGYQNVQEITQYWKQTVTKILLTETLKNEKLIKPTQDETMLAIMEYVNKEYPSQTYYTRDNRDEWNKPLTTLASLQHRKYLYQEYKRKWKKSNWYTLKKVKEMQAWTDQVSTDCDDYAILIYSLARAAGIPDERLYFCWMKTTTEWHMNLMYFDETGVPRAIEGTYYPEQAMKKFQRQSYFFLRIFLGGEWKHYYEFVRWIWNEEKVLVNPYYKRK